MPSSVIPASFWPICVAVLSSCPKSPGSVSSGRSTAHRTAPTRRVLLQLRVQIRVFLVLVYRIYLLPLLFPLLSRLRLSSLSLLFPRLVEPLQGARHKSWFRVQKSARGSEEQLLVHGQTTAQRSETQLQQSGHGDGWLFFERQSVVERLSKEFVWIARMLVTRKIS